MADIAKHVRAARAYAGLSQEQLAERLELDVQTVKRTEAGTRTPKAPELRAIAEECGVPREFLTDGFDYQGDGGLTLAQHDQHSSELVHQLARERNLQHEAVLRVLEDIREVTRDHLLPYLAEQEPTPADASARDSAGAAKPRSSSRTARADAPKGDRAKGRQSRGGS